MPIYVWKNGAVLLTKAARYVGPIVIAGLGAVGGWFARRSFRKKKTQKKKSGQRQ